MPKAKSFSALNAARLILEQAAAPLHYEEITRRVLAQALWQTSGKTPSATVNAHLAVDIKRKGAASAFVRTAPGIYALNAAIIEKRQRRGEEPAPDLFSLSAPQRVPHPNRLSNTDAAERILETSVSRQLHYREITRLAIEQNLLDPAGKTPEATMYAQILTEVKRRRQRDEPQRFMLLGKGMVSLAKWQASGIAYQVDEANKQAREKLLKHVKAMKPYDFENLVSQLLLALGFEQVEVTSRSNDGGIDVRGTLVVGDVIRTRLAVQVKRWKNNVQAPVIQQVRGSLGTHEQGLIITTSDFSKGAREEATRANATPVGLMDGEQLVDLLIQNEIGITLTPLQLIQLYTPANP